jgi:hypothetical protein
MSVTSTRLATQILVGMQDAIDKKDMKLFREYLNDMRVGNVIIGNKKFEEKYHALCFKALNLFL